MAVDQQFDNETETSRASAQKAFDTAEALWGSTSGDPVERAQALPSIDALLRVSAKAALASLNLPPAPLPLPVDPEQPLLVVAEPPHPARPLADGVLNPTGPLEEQRVDAQRKGAAELLGLATAADRARLASRAEKIRRTGAIAIGGLIAAGISMAGVLWLTAPKDLTIGHPWKASSKLADCHPEVPECAGARIKVFFHTVDEDNPWVQWDLEAPKAMSSATIVNRSDVALERALPLIIEVSDDGTTWKEVARREKSFDTWRARFSTTTARYIRARVPRRTQLHLEAFRVHP